MRSLGVPARTVVGYYPGEYDEAQGGFIYRQLNAHAWTEVYFPRYGWIPFEPTSNRPLEERETTVAPDETETPVPTQEVPTPDVSHQNAQATPIPDERTIENPGPPQPVVVDEGDGGMPGWVLPAAGTILAISVAGLGAWLSWNWKLRGLSPIESLFARTQRVGRLGGVQNGPTTTPREYASQFSQKLPAMGPPVRRIVQVYESDRFGPGGADEGSIASAKAAWLDLRRKAMQLLIRARRKRGAS
jgi:hypothetical protein